MYHSIRSFMAERAVLEVETPYLSQASNPDPHIINLQLRARFEPQSTWYLHSSPEFPMKRLLSSGSGSIYQIARVFRDDEQGVLHNPEFTMLEWYRIDFDHHDLMDELDELLNVLGFEYAERIRYRDIFLEQVDIDPFLCDDQTLFQCAETHGLVSSVYDRPGSLDFLFSHLVTPKLGLEQPCFIYDYPCEQSALARQRIENDFTVAERFELFIQGMEIANGYHELNDAEELRARFAADNEYCREHGLPHGPVDENLIDTTDDLPDCAGVAVGLDRLMMTILNIQDIDQVLCFPVTHA